VASASSRAAAAAINHVLAPAEWAREALRGHAGRVARFVLPPVEVVLAVTPDGQAAPAPDGAGADLGITLSPGDALRVLSGEATASALARIEGDAAFGATIRHLFHNLRWDFEEDLSKIMGDIAAHRAAGALRALAGLPGEVAARLGGAAAEYATEEARLVPPRAEVEAWMAEVDRLRDDVARLEARLARLAPQRED
jgi:ubiquinone biosynthesis protein UbiJ